MATASDLIRRAMRLIRAIDPGEAPTAHEEKDALDALNAMLGSWSIQRQAILVLTSETFAMTGAASYSIGENGDLDTVRPINIDAVSVDGSVYKTMTQQEWILGLDGFNYRPGVPLGTLHVRGVSGSSMTLESWKPLTGTLGKATPIALPEGYDEAIAYNLAIRIAPEFGKMVSAEVAEVARVSLAAVKRMNASRNTPPARFDDMPVVHRYCDGLLG